MELCKRQSPVLGYSLVPTTLAKILFSIGACIVACIIVVVLARCLGNEEALGLDSPKKRHGYFIYRYILGPDARRDTASDEELDEDFSAGLTLNSSTKFEINEIGGDWTEKPTGMKFNWDRLGVFLIFLFTTFGAVYCTILGQSAIMSRFQPLPKDLKSLKVIRRTAPLKDIRDHQLLHDHDIPDHELAGHDDLLDGHDDNKIIPT